MSKIIYNYKYTKLLKLIIILSISFILSNFIRYGFINLSFTKKENISIDILKENLLIEKDISISNNVYKTLSEDSWFLYNGNLDKKLNYLTIDLKNLNKDITLNLYYSKDNNFSEKEKVVHQLHTGKNFIKLPRNMDIKALRIDIGNEKNIEFTINSLKLTNKINYDVEFYIIFLLLFILIYLIFFNHNILKRTISSIGLTSNEWKYVFFCMFIYYLWSVLIPFGQAPDEPMRYDIAKFIFENGYLPHGGDPSIRDEIWGTSYGFTPILSYTISGYLMRLFYLLGTGLENIYLIARFTSVVSSTITVIFVTKISKELFLNKSIRSLFVVLVSLLPQFIFISSYVNNDSFAIMCISAIIYFWIRGIKSTWNTKSCIGLGVSISLCSLSYYNAYSFILMSIFVFIFSHIFNFDNKRIYNNINFVFTKIFFKKILLIVLIFIIMSGWWFIRSYIIYDGDFLGLRTFDKYVDMYGIESLKTFNRQTPSSMGYSLKYMLFDMGWIDMTIKSFVAVFGWMDIMINDYIYYIYYAIIMIGIIFFIVNYISSKQFRRSHCILFNVCIFLASIITIILSINYSYSSGFQPQGRYIMPILIPLMYFVSSGFNLILEKRILKSTFITTICCVYIILSIYCLTNVIIPYYYI